MMWTVILSVVNLACGFAGLAGLTRTHWHWVWYAGELVLGGALAVIAFDERVKGRPWCIENQRKRSAARDAFGDLEAAHRALAGMQRIEVRA